MTKYKITARDRKIDARNLRDYEDDKDKENYRHKRALVRIHKKYEISARDRKIDSRNGKDARNW